MKRFISNGVALVWLLLAAATAQGAALARFDTSNSQITLPTVRVDATLTFVDVVLQITAFGIVQAEDASVGTDIEYLSNGNRLLLPGVTVGTTSFNKVSLTGATFTLVRVGGQVQGSPGTFPSSSLATVKGLKDTAFGAMGYRNSAATMQPVVKAVALAGRKEVYLFRTHSTKAVLGRSIVRFSEEGVWDSSYASKGVFEVADNNLELAYATFAVDKQGRATYISWPVEGDGQKGALVKRLDSTGQPDVSFGSGGSLQLNPSKDDGHPYSHIRVATALDDDSLLLAGYAATARYGATRDWVIWKLLPSGQLDTSFGRNGVASVTTNAIDEPSLLTVAKTGEIYLSGRRADAAKTWVVAKFSAAGVHDTGYGSAGLAPVGVGDTFFLVDLLADPSGSLVAVGQAIGSTAKPQGLVTRLLASGAVDTTFGTAGRAFVNFYNQPTPAVSDTFNDTANRVWQDDAGRILVGGYALDKSFNGRSTAYSTVVRLLASGELDPSFFGGATTALAQASNYGFISGFPSSNIWVGEVLPVFPSADGAYVWGVLTQFNTSVHSFVRWK